MHGAPILLLKDFKIVYKNLHEYGGCYLVFSAADHFFFRISARIIDKYGAKPFMWIAECQEMTMEDFWGSWRKFQEDIVQFNVDYNYKTQEETT